jgi:hypothetical protein
LPTEFRLPGKTRDHRRRRFSRGAVVPLKKNVDDALQIKDAAGNLLSRSVQKVIVLRRSKTKSTSKKAATSGGIANWSM